MRDNTDRALKASCASTKPLLLRLSMSLFKSQHREATKVDTVNKTSVYPPFLNQSEVVKGMEGVGGGFYIYTMVCIETRKQKSTKIA